MVHANRVQGRAKEESMITALFCLAIIIGSGDLLPPIIKLLAGVYGVLSLLGFIGPVDVVRGYSGGRQNNWYYDDHRDDDFDISFDYGDDGGGDA